MAKQRGIVFFEGTIGGINFYYRKGVPTARAAGGGFTRKAIKTGAHMVRVREHNSEFARCSKVNKVFKQAIRPFMLGYKDGTLHSRLMQLFLNIKDCDGVSERGKRVVFLGMDSEKGKQLFKDFVFTPKRSNILPCDYDFDWNTLTFSVSGFEVNAVGFPKEADYMELVLGVVRFDFETKRYTRVMAAPLVIERDFLGDSFTVAVSELPSGTGTLFAMVRVAFYQEVNGDGYLLSGGNAFRVQVVGI
ncbi:hypothetical protein [Psychroserpens mesophilus]|uniref:hypothetical protein n=1 Tax=Psychroserpens mesophilus TaxID=325473 RepID=UPI003D656D37